MIFAMVATDSSFQRWATSINASTGSYDPLPATTHHHRKRRIGAGGTISVTGDGEGGFSTLRTSGGTRTRQRRGLWATPWHMPCALPPYATYAQHLALDCLTATARALLHTANAAS